MADRTFTLDEAQELLPVLEGLLRKAIRGKKQVEKYETEFDELRTQIMLSGGMLIDLNKVALRKALQDKVLQQVKDAIQEIDAIGVQVKDLDAGLLDFPWINDPDVLLCWKLGEKQITHWHNTTEGFPGRKPIDERIASVRRNNPS